MASIRSLRLWLTEGLWQTRVRDLPRHRRIPVKILKLGLLTGRAFQKQQDTVRAAALTLYTLLSIVPVTALLFGIAKGFGLDETLENWLRVQFRDQAAVIEQTVVMARRALANTQGGLVAGAGVLFLVYSVIKVIDNIEQAFNGIWSVTRSRSWSRKITDYVSLLLIGPFLVVGASSLNVYVAAVVSRAAETAPLSHLAEPAVNLALRLAPLLLLWLLFSFTYAFIPNTKVKVPSTLVGGAVAAFLYQMVQTLYIGLQVGVSKTNAIYGSFAALPLFLLWLHLSWRIVLLGAELTHQHQEFESNEREEHIPELSFRAVKRLALRICDYAGSRFLRSRPPATAGEMAVDLGIPATLLNGLLARLVRCGILVETVREDPAEPGYAPARDPHRLTPSAVLEALENMGEDLAEPQKDRGRKDYEDLLEEFDRIVEKNPANRPLSLTDLPDPRR
jgi:membrane protein